MEGATAVSSLEQGSAPSVALRAPAVPSARGRAHGAHLRRVAAFFALLALCVAGLHALIHVGLRRITTSTFGTMNRIVDGRLNADIVISGSSRALVHYDPRIISAATGLRTFNLGRNGAQTDMQVAALKSYLAHNAKPRLVIHNLDLFSLHASREIYDPAQYMPYLGDEAIYATVRRIHPDAWKWKYVPLYGYVVADLRFTWLLGLKRLAGLEPAEDQFDGFVPRPWTWSDDFEKFRHDHPSGYTTPVDPQGLRDFEELLAICSAQDIPVLLVYSPEYLEIQSLQTNRAVIFSHFRALAERHGTPLWDFSEAPVSRRRELFYNSQHLNADGAALFSEALAQRLVHSPLLANARTRRE